MKIFIVAAAAWAAGALLGYFVARLAYKHLRKRLRTLRQERKPPKKKMGTMDRILVLEAVFLVAYTVADLVVFWHTGSEPATLTGCVFGVCGLENGVMLKNTERIHFYAGYKNPSGRHFLGSSGLCCCRVRSEKESPSNHCQ